MEENIVALTDMLHTMHPECLWCLELAYEPSSKMWVAEAKGIPRQIVWKEPANIFHATGQTASAALTDLKYGITNAGFLK